MVIQLIRAEHQPKDAATPWLHPDWGFKPCANTGLQRAWRSPVGIICPGCNRQCLLPEKGFEHGDTFLTVVRPQE